MTTIPSTLPYDRDVVHNRGTLCAERWAILFTLIPLSDVLPTTLPNRKDDECMKCANYRDSAFQCYIPFFKAEISARGLSSLHLSFRVIIYVEIKFFKYYRNTRV